MKKGERGQGSAGNDWINGANVSLKGGVLAAIITLLMLGISSLAVAWGVVTPEYMWPLLLGGCMLGSFVAGMVSSRKNTHKRLVKGIGIGVVEFLIYLTAGIMVYGAGGDEGRGVMILMSCICGGMLSGVRPGKGKKKRRKK